MPHKPFSPAAIALLIALTMTAFAANSLLCRAALMQSGIDPATFTAVRLVSGALTLWLIVRARDGATRGGAAGSWSSALALFGYAAGFSFAYVQLPAAAGALILFGAVQATMIGFGLWKGERLRPSQTAGVALALGGLIALLLPGLTAPPLEGAILMAGAGVAWGVYSLRGKGAGDPLAATAGNFLRSVPLAIALGAAFVSRQSWSGAGVGYAIASGALASGVGYAIWYTVAPRLSAIGAATVQLSVPVLAAGGGALFLGETLTGRLALCGLAILGGIGLVTGVKKRDPANGVK